MPTTNYITLWEYDAPISHTDFLNYGSGIWQWYISPAFDGVKTVVDDRGVTGTYRDNNATVYDIQSFTADYIQYSRVYTYADLVATNRSFLYTRTTTLLLVHFDNFEPPFTFEDIVYGATVGFSKGVIGDNKSYFNNIFYEPRLNKIFSIKKSKDPLFFGLLKYTSGTVSCSNEDGYFDDWTTRNLFSQATRLKIGENGAAYSTFLTTFTGQLEDDSRTWQDFSVKLQDPRKGLTQPIATNLLTKTVYPSLPDENVDKPKPVAYGTITNAPCMCLNETASSGYHTFLLCDTEFNAVYALTTVYLNGVSVTVYDSNLTAGTFRLAATASVTINGEVNTVADNLDAITADFNANNTDSSVEIMEDLIYRYDNKPYISNFWDTGETDEALLLCWPTSVYVNDNKKLNDVLEQICIDSNALFFCKDDGRYTIRIYDSNRAVTRIIQQDEWLDDPKIETNSSEFLSSVIIKYKHNIEKDKYEQYEHLDYQHEVYDRYRAYKTTTIETNLYDVTYAEWLAEEIMLISKSVGMIVERTIPYGTDIEIMDLIQAAPTTRRYTKKGVDITPVYGVYEVLGIKKDLDKYTRTLTMRYVRAV